MNILGKRKSKSDNKVNFDQNKIKYYYGIPHCHSSYSTGKGTPYDLYEYAIKCRLDYLFVTDHNDYLLNNISIKDHTFSRWNATVYYSNKIRRNFDNFLPVVGFECKSPSYGHFNIINSNIYFTGPINNFSLLTLWMMNNPNSFIIINHPHKDIYQLNYNDVLNKLITCSEVFNGNCDSKYTRHDKQYYHLLDQGWKLGAVNGQDNHKINFNNNSNLTVYIGNELSKKALIDAFRKHRTYSTESRYLKLHFTINNVFMGETLYGDNPKLKFLIFVEDIKYKIKEIQIISNGGTIVKKIEDIELNNIKYIYEHKKEANETWYLIKVLQDDNKTAISSPVFIDNFINHNY